jgi:hypothetical protein
MLSSIIQYILLMSCFKKRKGIKKKNKITYNRARDVAQWFSVCLACMRPWV